MTCALKQNASFLKIVQILAFVSSLWELIKRGLLSVLVKRLSINIPDSLMNLCNAKQLRLPLITFYVFVLVGRNSHSCCLQDSHLRTIHFLICHHIKTTAIIACVTTIHMMSCGVLDQDFISGSIGSCSLDPVWIRFVTVYIIDDRLDSEVGGWANLLFLWIP